MVHLHSVLSHFRLSQVVVSDNNSAIRGREAVSPSPPAAGGLCQVAVPVEWVNFMAVCHYVALATGRATWNVDRMELWNRAAERRAYI